MITRIMLIGMWLSFTNVIFANNLDSLYRLLDEEILKSDSYVNLRKARIGKLRDQLHHLPPQDVDRIYAMNLSLYDEYKAYVLDSSIYFLNRNLDLANSVGNKELLNDTHVRLSYILASTGMYNEALEFIREVNPDKLSEKLLADYYAAYDHIYGEMGCYTLYKRVQQPYYKKSDAYKDSLFNVLSPDSHEYMHLCENMARSRWDFKEAMRLNDLQKDRFETDTPDYAIWAFFRAINYRGLEDRENEKYWLAVSAIADIRGAVKDHASLWMLADILRSEGDIDRAHKYIRFSWDETVRFNARLRAIQSSEILSMIDQNYQAMSKQAADRLRVMLCIISVMALLLILTIFYLQHQKKKLAKTRNHLKVVNGQLLKLNRELSDSNCKLDTVNRELSDTNQRLSEINRIKEEYIGRFLGLCSIYIDKLNSFRNIVNKKLAANQITELQKLIKSSDFQEKELADLYHHFDTAFLHLFPGFVTDFNALLKENEQIVPAKQELLNTELRIFALIRLGVEDSSRIADFLHYSPNTIYNYRARVKNKARISRDEFEQVIKTLG
ncbi:MAG: DUF6377 domain-containing protein [Bacteroidales bacterium]